VGSGRADVRTAAGAPSEAGSARAAAAMLATRAFFAAAIYARVLSTTFDLPDR
jgi:hypothetical protein